MKLRHVFPVALAVLGCSYSISVLNEKAFASPQSASGQSTSGNQNLQTLPPEKKKFLPRMGPDELFPGETERGATANQGARTPANLRSTTKPFNPRIPAPAVTAVSAASPIASPAVEQPPPSPAADPPRITLNSHSSQSPPFDWQIPALGSLTLVVFIGLLYVLARLRELLRDGGR